MTEPGSDPGQYLAPTFFLDCDHADVARWAREATQGAEGTAEKTSRLFLVVRDQLRYDPYAVSQDRADYRASEILKGDAAFCVPKAVLLAAGARALGIPARLGFADVVNHLSSESLRAAMGTDLFVYHGYVELWIDGRWVKATPAFDEGLCRYFGVAPLEFDGRHDALLQAFDEEGQQCMQYVRERGVFADLPFEEIRAAFLEHYGHMA
ncbi:MAG TPA: transglutaminase family protein [Polyangiaceae bacterium]|nr:transglutaminase family protein [Polyangiaceae bacterium]